MFKIHELPIDPVLISQPLTLPIKILLALPEGVMGGAEDSFSLPAFVAELTSTLGWSAAMSMIRPRIWAPGWNDDQLRGFIWRATKNFPPGALEDLRAKEFPQLNRGAQCEKYQIIHYCGSFVSRFYDDPVLRLRFANNYPDDYGGLLTMPAGVLRDTLIASGTRLLILEVVGWGQANALALAAYVTGAGGPAVLVVRHAEVAVRSEYLHDFYSKLFQNVDLRTAAEKSSGGSRGEIEVHLFEGNEGHTLLQFNRLFREFEEELDQLESLVSAAGAQCEVVLERHRNFLHRSQIKEIEKRFLVGYSFETGPSATGEGELVRTLAQVAPPRELRVDLEHASAGSLEHLWKIADTIPHLELANRSLSSRFGGPPKFTGFVEAARPQWLLRETTPLWEEINRTIQSSVKEAPRVINANFFESESRDPISSHRPLAADHEYSLLVDVGPRWDKTISIVGGNADFPEDALPPNGDGHLIKVVLISDDFIAVETETVNIDDALPNQSDADEVEAHDLEVVDVELPVEFEDLTSFDADFQRNLITRWLWLPRDSGRSFPFVGREKRLEAGPIEFRVRTPAVTDDSAEFLKARGRLCFYFQNNLLQSAIVEAEIGQSLTEHQTVVANKIEVDFVLTGSFRDLEKLATRRLRTEAGEEKEYPIGLSLTLNDDGAQGHRIIVENHPELTVSRPYDPDAAEPWLRKAREKLKDCFWSRNSDTCRFDPGSQRTPGLRADNGKTKDQFKCDLFNLAFLGSSLFSQVVSQVHSTNWRDWRRSLREALREKTVIQVARVGLAQYVLPWAMLYDIPLPDKQIRGKLRWCKGVEQWSEDGKRQVDDLPKRCPELKAGEDHASNTLCPYGFWGLKHYIEQPINVLPIMSTLIPNAPQIISVGGETKMVVGATRDKALDAATINDHLTKVAKLTPFTPENGADDLQKVRDMLMSPHVAYFLCHGEYDPKLREPFLGVGPRDEDMKHRIYPDALTEWAVDQETFWSDLRLKPLIFINGCHTSNLTPGEILNFVSTFANLGASGVIGTDISISLPLATEIGEKLLRQLLTGSSIGEAMYQLRWELANKGNMLGLAYTAYCMSNLRITSTTV